MKERTIIERLPCEKDICKKDDCAKCYTEHSRVEQVPETWEELKELCKGLKGIEFFYDKVACVEYININDVIAFNENGLMLTTKHNYDILAKRRTLQQMWQIIKNLVGE